MYKILYMHYQRGWLRPSALRSEARPRGVTPRPRSGAAAESARLRWLRNGRKELPKSKVRGSGWEELPHIRGQGRWLGGATPSPRSGGCEGTGGPRGAIPRSTYGRGGGEEIPLIQGKEQWLRFAGVAVKRYPTPKVRETQVRW